MEVRVVKINQDIDSNRCLVSKELFNSLRLSEKSIYRLNLGRLSLRCQFSLKETTENSLYLPEKIFNQMLLYGNHKLDIWRNGNGIYIGPTLGILISEKTFKAMRKGRVKLWISEYLRNDGALRKCMSYCFCTDNIEWNEKRIKGLVYMSEKNRWDERWLPMPDVIYNRTVDESIESEIKTKEVMRKFRELSDICFINNHDFISKWLVYKSLSKYNDMKELLPDTIKYRFFEDVLNMLDKHEYAFIKSSTMSGSGDNISIMKYEGRYKITLKKGGIEITLTTELEKVKAVTENFISRKKLESKGSFVVQKGIKVLKYNEGNIAVNILVVKDEAGKWKVVNIYLNQNNELLRPFNIVYPELKEVNKEIVLQDENALKLIVTKAAAHIDNELGTFGELDLKVLIDIHGGIWLLDCNPSPHRSYIPVDNSIEKASPEAEAIFSYAKYLAVNHPVKRKQT